MRLSHFLAVLMFPAALLAQDAADSVVVVYNSRLADSRDVAQHYAAVRHVPAAQVFGLDMTTEESMSRAEFTDQLEKPLLARLQESGLMIFDGVLGNGFPGKFVSSKIRYVTLCYGVPLVVREQPDLIEDQATNITPVLRRNGAAVDAEIAVLPGAGKVGLIGPLENPFYGSTNPAAILPSAEVLLVGRLDGPTAAVARALVDKAVEAETNGLWGRAYFDLRGITNGPTLEGDQWIDFASEVARGAGFETIVDNKPETFNRDFPMSQIALYAGWYEAHPTGPFTLPRVEFMPGAFAYHLYSFSAWSLRNTNEARRSWCETLLEKGATATMGCVDEPYLEGTPNLAIFFDRWVGRGYSFGEAALVSQHVLSWQTTVIGDPLYRPFGRTPRAQHEALVARHSDLAAWSFIRIVNVELGLGAKLADTIKFLEHEPLTARSAPLSEKLGDLKLQAKDLSGAMLAYQQALRLNPTPQQAIRLTRAAAAAGAPPAP